MFYTTSAPNHTFKPITTVLVNGEPFLGNYGEPVTGKIEVELFPSGKVVSISADTVIYRNFTATNYDGVEHVDDVTMMKDGVPTSDQYFKPYGITVNGHLYSTFKNNGPLFNGREFTNLYQATIALRWFRKNDPRARNLDHHYEIVELDLAFDGMPIENDSNGDDVSVVRNHRTEAEKR